MSQKGFLPVSFTNLRKVMRDTKIKPKLKVEPFEMNKYAFTIQQVVHFYE